MPNGDGPHGIPSTLREFLVRCPKCAYATVHTTGTWKGTVNRLDDSNCLCPNCKQATMYVIEERCAMCHRSFLE